MMRRRLLVLFLGFALAIGLVGAAAAVPYAPPSLSVVDRGLFRITLGITAGANGSPAGFTMQWMKKSDYDALGGWAPLGDPRLKYCNCYGPYVLNQWAGSPIMNAGETSYLQLGDLKDESVNALYGNDYSQLGDPLGPPYRSWQYVVRAYTEGDANGDQSDYSATLGTDGSVSTMSSECTQGFWGTHGPAPCHTGNNANVWPASCFPMTLGTNQYTEAQICQILMLSVNGNGLISLEHQLITTLLNGCNNSDLSSVQSTINAAQALIDGQDVLNGGFLSPSSTSAYTETLDDYNNGLLGGVANCPTPVQTNTTWGRIKVLYR